jgi:hypothetical protein
MRVEERLQDDALAPSQTGGARNGRVDHPGPAAADSPELGRTGVAEHRASAAREHCRHPLAFIAEADVADGINTTMNGVKAGGLDTAADRARGQAGCSQLRQRNDSVLPSSNPGKDGVRVVFVAFVPHVREEGDNSADLSPLHCPVFVPACPGSPMR